MDEGTLKQALASFKGAVTWCVLFSLGINLLMLTVPLFLLQIYDRVLTSRSAETLLVLTLIAAFALLTFGILEAIRRLILSRIALTGEQQLGPGILSSILAESPATGGIRSVQGLRDLSTLRNFVSGNGLIPILDAPWSVIFVVVIYLLHPALGWFAIGALVVLATVAVTNDFATRKALRAATTDANAGQDFADSVIRNSEAIAAMGMAGGLISRWTVINNKALSSLALGNERGGVFIALSRFLRLIVQISMLALAAWLVLQGEISPGGLIAASILLSRALVPVEQMIGSWRATINARQAYINIERLLRSHDSRPDTLSLPEPKGLLEVETMSYVHPGQEEPVLKAINYRLQPGESLGLIGPTGAGKTTLARLLLGITAPRMGAVRLDGMNVSVWNPENRGQYVGYLPQDVELFQGTVAENICRFTDADTDAILAAAELAGVHDTIMRLPKGYDTEIGENGLALSGGQRQRIALARAVFGNVRLVILDEPNANQDRMGEEALVETLRRLKQQQVTTVIIAHRPNILETVDKLLVLRNGRMEMFGPKVSVINKLMQGQEQVDLVKSESRITSG